MNDKSAAQDLEIWSRAALFISLVWVLGNSSK